MSELKACPFCGGDVGQNAYWDYWCTNPLCAIHHVAFRTKERWNTRTPDTSAKVDVERLEWWKKQYQKLYEGGAEKLAEHGVIVDDVETHMEAIGYMEAESVRRRQKQAPRSDTSARLTPVGCGDGDTYIVDAVPYGKPDAGYSGGFEDGQYIRAGVVQDIIELIGLAKNTGSDMYMDKAIEKAKQLLENQEGGKVG